MSEKFTFGRKIKTADELYDAAYWNRWISVVIQGGIPWMRARDYCNSTPFNVVYGHLKAQSITEEDGLPDRRHEKIGGIAG
jgi:hypothetical protein